jgi:hypothetical protein
MSEMNDDVFLAAFEACTLRREEWTHRAHVRMAWLYLRRLPFEEALARIRSGIQKLNAEVVQSAGYHETITVALSRIIGARIRDDPRELHFDVFAAHEPDLLDGDCRILLSYYSRETIMTSRAKARFVPPDIAPLPMLGSTRGGSVPHPA